jgi:hypothetical protein
MEGEAVLSRKMCSEYAYFGAIPICPPVARLPCCRYEKLVALGVPAYARGYGEAGTYAPRMRSAALHAYTSRLTTIHTKQVTPSFIPGTSGGGLTCAHTADASHQHFRLR